MSPFHILLAEDNPADVYLLRTALQEQRFPFELTVAPDGKSALHRLRDVCQGEPGSPLPDLILLDLNLPQHDGVEILQTIRTDPRLSAVPVVVLTSSGSPRDRRAVDLLGVTRYIRKPFNLDEFLNIGATLKELLTARPEETAGTGGAQGCRVET